MASTRVCRRCGVTVEDSSLRGYCLSCLLREGLTEGSRNPEIKDPALELSSPHIFGKHELLEKIGQGGMGMVYRARQLDLDRIVAIKLLPFGPSSGDDAVQRFRMEASAAAGLQHPNIVAIHEVGEVEGRPFFSMDFIEGQTLAAMVREQPLPARRAAAYLKTIAEAVHYAHQHGILHRDLKPSNVLIDEADQPRITDFGLAKRLGSASDLTLTGQVLGSPNFMSPEQAESRSQAVGPPSDIYSLGGLLYHLLTRQPPFQADTLTTLLKQVMESDPVPPRLLNPSIPRDLETICLKCLQKEPHRRYATAQELADELGRFLEDKPIQARPVSLPAKVGRWCRRQPVRAGLIGALAMVFALGFAGVLWQWRRTELQRTRAEAGELLARQNTYAADMSLAQHALADNNPGLALRLLNEHCPTSKSGADLRHWEWRYLWQLCQGDESITLRRIPRSIRTMAVSKDGAVLALTWRDNFELWDLNTKRSLAALQIATTEALAFSPTSNLLAMGTQTTNGQPAVNLWDVATRKITQTLTNEAAVGCVAFSPDGKLLATFDHRGNIKVADWVSDQTLTNFTVRPPRGRPVGVVVFSPDGNRLAIGESYGQVQILDLRTGTMVALQTPRGEVVNALAFSASARLLAAGMGRAVRLWDANSGEPRGQLTNHTDEVTALAFASDGRQLASASLDETIRIWTVANLTELRCLRGSGNGLKALAWLPNGHTLVTAGDGGFVRLWDATASNRAFTHTNWTVAFGYDSMSVLTPAQLALKTLDPRAVRRLGFTFTPDSRGFITTDRYGSLALWDTRSVRVTENLPALGSNHWGVALSPDGLWLATGRTPETLTLWDWATRRAVTNFTVPCEFSGRLRFSRSGNFLFAVALNNEWESSTRIWHTGDWKEVALTEDQCADLWAVDLSPDDRHLAAGYQNGAVKLFHFPSGDIETTFTNHRSPVSGVIFSLDGQGLVSSSFDTTARLWDVSALLERAKLQGHFGMICSVALSPDGRRAVTGGSSPRDAVKLWDLVAHREVLTLQAEGQHFMRVAFSPDGNTLAALSFDGIAHLWRAPSWEEIEEAKKKQRSP